MICDDRFKGLSVLFVEDEEQIGKLMKSAIGDMFGNFHLAYDGKEGLEVFKKHNIDIVISDIMMPNMDGFEMSMRIKEIAPSTPIIILSAFSEKERLLGAIDIGVDKYLIKPIDPDELLESVCALAKKEKLGEKFLNLYNGYRFDMKNVALYYKQEHIPLTAKELKFISVLCSLKDSHATHRELKRKVWRDSSVSSAAMRAFVKRLRIKTDKELIINIPKIGYKISLDLS